eukprot:12614692-Alexandrium_andersonii.AAC.1
MVRPVHHTRGERRRERSNAGGATARLGPGVPAQPSPLCHRPGASLGGTSSIRPPTFGGIL